MSNDGQSLQKRNGADSAREFAADGSDVIVEIFLGDKLLTLAELNKLKKGDVLPLGVSLADPAELRVNGRCIGRGELVAVGDQFAVRISEIA